MDGLIHAHMVVLQLPPKLSVKSLVNLLSLKGTCYSDLSLARADMQLLKAAMDLLMFFASYNRRPSEPVLLKRSLPARSTMVRRALR